MVSAAIVSSRTRAQTAGRPDLKRVVPGKGLAAVQCGHILMTMSTARRTLPAATFKAQCLALLDRVAQRGEVLVVTKRGKPVAQIVPIEKGLRRPLRGSVRYHGDLVAPLDEKWDADR